MDRDGQLIYAIADGAMEGLVAPNGEDLEDVRQEIVLYLLELWVQIGAVENPAAYARQIAANRRSQIVAGWADRYGELE